MTGDTGAAVSAHVRTRSATATHDLAVRLGRACQPGDVIALVGELGAGKTTFVAGLAAGLGVGPEIRVQSPTFTLINEYHGRVPLYHLDYYRLAHADELDELGVSEYLEGSGVCAIEWFDRFPSLAPAEYLEVRLAVLGPRRRELAFTAHGVRAAARLCALAGLRVG
jgi:tRNA threonylcarbamoyladenosine biosynthesis protein TsaE